MRVIGRRPLGLAVAASLLLGATACATDGSDGDQPPVRAAASSVVMPEPFTYNGQVYCVYPDDLDDVSPEAVEAYCAGIRDPKTGEPVASTFWFEAEQPGNYDGTDERLSSEAWTHYLVYAIVWFLADAFIKVFLKSDALRAKYRTKHEAYGTKYEADMKRWAPNGMYLTSDDQLIPYSQLGQRTLRPYGCKPVAYQGEAGSYVPAGSATPKSTRSSKSRTVALPPLSAC